MITIPIYLNSQRRVEAVHIVDDSMVPISAVFQDTSLSGAAVKAFAKFGDTVKSANCSVSGNTATFTPNADFFAEGRNRLQFEINSKIVSFAVDVICERRISKGG